MWVLLKTRSKQDLRTIKHHLTLLTHGTLLNLANMSVWELKNRNIHYTIKWKLLKRAKPYNCASNRCKLCLWEKYFIICKPKMATLNKRNELVSACRHNKKFLLIK